MNAVVQIRDDLQGVDARWLPPTIKRLITRIGLEATMRLLQRLGGTDLALPTGRGRGRSLAGSQLRQILSIDQIEALHAEFADGRKELTLPKVDKIVMQLRNHAIRSLHAGDGTSMARLALRFDLTERQVWNILHSVDAPLWRKQEQQAGLFD